MFAGTYGLNYMDNRAPHHDGEWTVWWIQKEDSLNHNNNNTLFDDGVCVSVCVQKTT